MLSMITCCSVCYLSQDLAFKNLLAVPRPRKRNIILIPSNGIFWYFWSKQCRICPFKTNYKKVTSDNKKHLTGLKGWMVQKDLSTQHSPVPKIIIFSTPSPEGIWKTIDLLELFHCQATYTTEELIVWKAGNKRQIRYH